MFQADQDIRDNSTLTNFLNQHGFANYEELCDRSNADPDWFWAEILKLARVRFSKPYDNIRDISKGPEFVRWATGATLNLAETCLDARIEEGFGDALAVDWIGDDGEHRSWTYQQLADEAARLANALSARGIKPGDRVGIYMPMIPEIEAAFLGLARMGVTIIPLFSGFSAPAIAARLNDGAAKAVLTVDATTRRGKPVPMEATLIEALAEVPTVNTVISLRRFGGKPADPARDLDWAETIGSASPEFAPVPVSTDHPLLIAYTSGTTGKPKGVVHTHLGVIGKTQTDFLLALDMKPGDRYLWMTDMGWVMGPLSVVSTLLAGATLVMAEGAPSQPTDPFRLLRLAGENRVTHMGVAPTLVRQFMQQDPAILKDYDLSPLRIVASTGEPWTEDAWLWHLEHICRHCAVPLNISGGTELFGAIVTSTVLHRLKPGGFSAQSLGVGAKVLRADGSEADRGEVGELVVTVPPLGLTPTLWQNEARYLETYWGAFKGIWQHGDWVRHDPDGTWYILGRSDDTLNIAGKRIGPPEIEGAMTQSGEVIDVAAIAAPDDLKGVAVICVCVAAPGVTPDEALVERLKTCVGDLVSKPFRPREIYFVDALPKTRTMKTMRRVVRAAFLGLDQGDMTSIDNPETIAPIQALRKA